MAGVRWAGVSTVRDRNVPVGDAPVMLIPPTSRHTDGPIDVTVAQLGRNHKHRSPHPPLPQTRLQETRPAAIEAIKVLKDKYRELTGENAPKIQLDKPAGGAAAVPEGMSKRCEGREIKDEDAAFHDS